MRIGSHGLHGRDDLLATAASRLADAKSGRGRLLLLSGEAGIGKTRLLHEIRSLAEADGFAVWTAVASVSDVELSAGLWLDLAHTLSRSPDQRFSGLGTQLLAGLVDVPEAGPGDGDAHRRRRLLVLDLTDRIASLTDGGPALLALEDLHWSDELSLDVVSHLARQLPGLPLLVVATLRPDELAAATPVRSWRSRLLLQRLADELPVTRLDRSDTVRMVRELLAGPVPRRVVNLVHRRSGGVPLHVEELVRAAERGYLADDPSHVPETLADAIQTRFGGLSGSAQEIAAAAAVLHRSFDLDLLSEVAGTSELQAARTVDELVERYFAQQESPGWYGFRHVLIREAIEAGVPLARRRELHVRIAEVARRRPELGGDGYRSAHHEAAGQLAEASAAASAAAARATALSSHQEALDLLHRAVRCQRETEPARRVDLLVRRAAEAAATDHVAQAVEDYELARQLLLDSGDPLAAAALLPGLVATSHLLGEPLSARLALLYGGLADVAHSEDAPEQQRVRASLLAAAAAACLVDDRLDDAIRAGEQALDQAPDDDEPMRLDTTVTLGSVQVFAGHGEEGWPRLESATTRARQLGLEAEAARGYRMLVSSASTLVEYDRADGWLSEGIDYADRTEQWNHGQYMRSHGAHVSWCVGRWDEADRAVQQLLGDDAGGITTRITALHVAGFLYLGRGRFDEAVEALEEARAAGEAMDELQRFAPALWGLAECAVIRRDPAAAVSLAERAFGASHEVADGANLFPFLVTGTRALVAQQDVAGAKSWLARAGADLQARGIPGTLPALDHAAGLVELAAGRTGKARRLLDLALTGWSTRRRWWETQWCTIDQARCAVASNRRTEASTLVERVRAEASRVDAVPLLAAADEIGTRLDRHDAAEPWSPLTLRELEVARLVAAGFTNREIGEALRITPRTAGAHLEHIRSKLGVSRRSEIAAWVTSVDSAAAETTS